MGEHHRNHRRQLIGIDNITTTPMEPTSDDMGNSSFQGLLRHGFHGSNIGAHARQQQDYLILAQNGPYIANRAVKDVVDGNSHIDNGVGGIVSQRQRDITRQLVGQALEDRRRLARDRIIRGGWKAHIASMAIGYIEQIAWKDLPSSMTCVQNFVKKVQELGEFFNDLKAIRCFLDRNIHKFITFHAMEKDFRVPDYFVRKASQTGPDGDLKYLWFRLFIREYQGRGITTSESLVQPYRAQGDEVTAGGFTSGARQIDQGGISGGTTATSRATTALSYSPGQDIKIPTIETSRISVDASDHTKKRKRAFDDAEEPDTGVLTTKVKKESTEDGFAEILGNRCDDGIAMVDIGAENTGEDRRQAKKRTLTVLFHGMRSDDAEESEHVQVYVPHTAKGVTINFL